MKDLSWKKILWVSMNVSHEDEEVFVPRTLACLNQSDEKDVADHLERKGYDLYQADLKDWCADDSSFARMYYHGKAMNTIDLKHIKTFILYDFATDIHAIAKFKSFISYALKEKKFVINLPETILHNLDKKYLLDLQQCGIPIIPTYLTYEDKMAFLNRSHGDHPILVKPRTGDKGDGIKIIRHDEASTYLGDDYIIQPFIEDFLEGEFSSVFLLNAYQCSIVRKSTPESGIFNNVSKGAQIFSYKPEPNEIDFCKNVLATYQSLGYQVIYGRVDYIKTRQGLILTEAEFANPILPMSFCKDFSSTFATAIQSLCQEKMQYNILGA